MMRQTSLQAAIELNRELTEADFRAEMGDIALPTLILHGTNDASAPLDLTGRRCAQLIKGSELKICDARRTPVSDARRAGQSRSAEFHFFTPGVIASREAIAKIGSGIADAPTEGDNDDRCKQRRRPLHRRLERTR
jgi:hypothetical protein